jgi:hypothetical protein
MSNDLFWVIFIGIWVIGIASAIFRLLRFYSLPTIKSYLRDNPSCKTGSGVSCCNCGSKSIRLWGLTSPESSLKLFLCNHCGSRLYRN